MKTINKFIIGLTALFASAWACAQSGQFTVTGALNATVCTVTVNGASSNTITLPTIATASLTGVGTTAGERAFSISLSGTTCSASSVTTYFEPSSSLTSSGGRLRNTASTSAATGVEVQVVNGGDGSVVNLAGGPGSQGVTASTIQSNAATQSFRLRYFQSTGTVTAGAFQSTLAYTLTYQ